MSGGTDEVITSRLLILQSKRLLLQSAQRRYGRAPAAPLKGLVERLTRETGDAERQYRAAVLAFGAPGHAEYWVMAYSRLAHMGNALATSLREAADQLPASVRYEVSVDTEMLEEIVEHWTESMRSAMSGVA